MIPAGTPGDGRRGAVERLSELFERIGGWCYDHRAVVLAVCAALLVGCALLASRVRFDNSFEAYFDVDDPVYTTYLRFREDFGSDEIAYILYEAPDRPHGPWDLAVMGQIAHLTRALEEEVPFVGEVTSLANVEFLEPIPDGIEIHDLLEDFPDSQEALLEVRRKVLAKPLYVGGLASRDGRHAAIILEMEKSSIDPLEEIRLDPAGGDGLDNLYPQASQAKIDEILARPEYAGIRFHHTGDVALNAVYNRIAVADSKRLAGICFAVIGLLLLFTFRRPLGVIGPLAVVGLSVLVSMAWAGALGWKLDLMFAMLPTLLIAVGVADSVHILSEFHAFHAELGDRREAVRRTLYLVGTPCLLTSLTTAVGFGAMAVSPIKAIAHFAVYSAVGVVAAFGLTITLLMVFLSLGRKTPRRDASAREIRRAKGGRLLRAALAAVARFDVRHRFAILIAFAAVFVFSALGVAQLRVDSNFLEEFGDDVPIRRTTSHVDDAMGGIATYTYVFDTGTPDGIEDPAVLREIERLQAAADAQGELVKKTYSIVDVLKDVNQTFHDGDPAFHALPETRDLVAQYLLLYEMSGGEEVEEYVSGDRARANLELRCKMVETSRFAEMTRALDRHLEANPVRHAAVSVTGMGALWLELLDYITQSQIRGFLLAFAAIAAMMCFIFRSVRTGLLGMVPNLSPVVLTLGMMGWLDMPLDYVRLLIGTVAIGIAVDDTIHHVTRYRHEFLKCGSYERALYASMEDVGRALFVTSAVLVAGFLVFLLAVMDSQATFGSLLATTIAVALLADFLLMPALVMTFEPFGPERAAGEDRVPSPARRAA